ncbi:lysophospholipid acyltransferase family protein [Thermomonas sp. HDW16]|uniref:lysophospholipid acyltransferase family protein n=1 Tax=Thermomonas sp. HDW16 TaxID=2714945 RepID=UPI001409E664|nr:lysophospholipid acyltransferase family protein [Thermomonas sp. HDW16]QIL19400.1 1-acyl-sn-glycerol-3-phosphate acyltransferase [Thermomonas sp. HDW16]
MSATPPAVESLLRILRTLLRLPLLACHVLVGLPIILVLIAIDTIGEKKVGHAAIRWWAGGLLWVFGMRVRQVGTPLPGGTMFVANHLSWVDIITLHSQHMMGFIAKAEIRDWPLIGWLAKAGESIFLQRGNAHSLTDVMIEMAARLRDGHAVAAFPEGGTRDGRELGAFHARIFTAAVEADAPVQPVALCFGAHCEAQTIVAFAPGESFMGNFVRLLGEPARPVTVYFLEPILHAEHEGRRRIATLARARIEQAMAAA